jgi:general secretion pathway protein M
MKKPALATLIPNPRERRLVVGTVVFVAVVLVFTVGVRPALKTLAAAPAERERLDAQLQSMQRLAAEAKSLRATPPVSPAQAQLALKAASERLGSAGRLVIQGDRATLTLDNATTNQIRDWLAEVRSGARARPTEATLARSSNGYSGTIVVVLQGGAA